MDRLVLTVFNENTEPAVIEYIITTDLTPGRC